MTQQNTETIRPRGYRFPVNLSLGIHGTIRWVADHAKNPFDRNPKKLNERQLQYCERYTLAILNLATYTGGKFDEFMLIDYIDNLAIAHCDDKSIQTLVTESAKESFSRLLGHGKESWFTKKASAINELQTSFEKSQNDTELEKALNRIMFGLHLSGEKDLKALSLKTGHTFLGLDSGKIDPSRLDLAEIYQYLGLEGLKTAFCYLQFMPEPPQTQGLAKMFDFMGHLQTPKIQPQEGVEYTFFKKFL